VLAIVAPETIGQEWAITRSLLPGECADMGGAQIGPSLCFGIDY